MKVLKFKESKYPFSFVMRCPDEIKDGLPLIIQLHGAGERGNGNEDLDLVEKHGFSKVFTEDKNYQCILIEPQCPKESFWVAKIPQIKEFIDQVADEFRVDKKRIYLTGLSMGGFGTWYTAMAYPDIFAAIAPVCGGGMPWNAGVLKMPVWAFHGDKDETVLPHNTTDMIDKLKLNNKDVNLTIYEGVAHNSWEKAYSKELLEWLLSKKLN